MIHKIIIKKDDNIFVFEKKEMTTPSGISPGLPSQYT